MRFICGRKLTLSLRYGYLLPKARQHSTINSSNIVRATGPRIKRGWLLLGGGLLAGSAIYSGSTIYLDSKNEDGHEKPNDQRNEQPSSLPVDDFHVNSSHRSFGGNISTEEWKIRRMDSAQLASNSPIEDYVSVTNLECTPSLNFVAITILDGHNGPQTAELLSGALPHTVGATLTNRFVNQVVHDNGVDVPSGRVFSRDEYSNQGQDKGLDGSQILDSVLSPEVIDEAIKEAFVKLDDHIVHETAQRVLGLSKEAYTALQRGESTDASPSHDGPSRRKISRSEAARVLEYAHSGSCAIMALYDPTQRVLRVAQTGDSRAVLGRRISEPTQGSEQQKTNDENDPKTVWETHVLSPDHNANNPAEAARLTALHPDEPELLKNGRTLGWGPSRAFGDASMKWSIPVQKRMSEEYMGGSPREICKTPPYFTAEPEVTTFQVQKGDFMVIATDGLWDCLTSEEVVGLTGWWVDERNKRVSQRSEPKFEDISVEISKNGVAIRGSFFEKIFGNDAGVNRVALEPKELPVKFAADYKDKTPMYPYWRAKKQFINVDERNVGKHLIRNALGGADQDLRGALLATKSPRSRRFRDDITVFVVFFD